MIKLNKYSTVYIVAPSDIATGGIECSYSLFSGFKEKEINTKMLLIHPSIHPQLIPNWKMQVASEQHYNAISIPDAYSQYIGKEDVVSEIIDSKDNLIIVPEIFPNVLDEYTNIQKSIWWLSVDNGLGSDQRNFHNKLTNPEYINVHHFFQSDYAYWFLLNHGAQYVYPLFDYIHPKYIQPITWENRENVILYNPKKGLEITQQLIKENPDLKFIALEGMNREELKELMLHSKIYIDFGNHPGKDKFPREAAVCGCVVITSFNGSARFFRDVTIDTQYKFDNTIEGVRPLIDNIFENFESHFNNFNLYRVMIKDSKDNFDNQIENLYQYEYTI